MLGRKPLTEGLVSSFMDGLLSHWWAASVFKICNNHVRNSGNACTYERKDRCYCMVSRSLTHSLCSCIWSMLD
jgi:hypothetical protein